MATREVDAFVGKLQSFVVLNPGTAPADCCCMIPVERVLDHLKIQHEREDELLCFYQCAAIDYMARITGVFWGCPRKVRARVFGSHTQYLKIPGNIVRVLELANTAICADEKSRVLNPDLPGPVPEQWRAGSQYLVRLDGHAWRDQELFDVTYEQGSEPADVPNDVVHDVLSLISTFYEQRVPVVEGQINEVPMSAIQNIKSRRMARA